MIATAGLFSRYDLLILLVQKELKLKYKGTALGMFWSLLSPLLMTVVYAVVFQIVLKFNVPRYPIFLLAGLLPWTYFQAAIAAGLVSVVGNGHLVRRVKFPWEFLPLTAVLANLVNIAPTFVVLLGYAIVDRQPLGAPLVLLPVLLALQTLFTAGLGILLAAVTVYFRDLQHLIQVILTVWFYATPVIYPASFFAGHRNVSTLIWSNPMTWVMVAYQDIWHADRWPDPVPIAGFALIAIALCAIGVAVFRRLEGRFAEEV